MPPSRLAARLVLLSLLIIPLSASAQSLPDDETSRRLDWIGARFDEAEAPSQAWWRGWLLFNSVVVVSRGVPAIHAENPDDRVSGAVASGMGALGVANLWVGGFESHRAAERFRARPDAGAADRAAKLEWAEETFKRAARAERIGVGWRAHTGTVLAALFSGGLVYVYGDHGDAYLQAAGTFVTAQLSLWTQPRRLMRAWEAYRPDAAAPPPVREGVAWRFGAGPTAVWAAVEFR